MKKILLLISLFACIAASAQLPPIPGTQPRSLPANQPQDYNLWVRNELGLPLFNDTTQANTNTKMDTCGRVIFTYDVDDFWIRKCNPSKHWERAGSGGFTILPNCGLQNGTGIVTYDDSTLNFDISPAIYALCCDHVPRVAPFTHVTLDSNTSDNPRIDAIVLTAHGDSVIKGVPDPNPAQPQLTDCQILLTYVTINAHENIPANFTIDPVIYDQVIIPPQWDTLATAVTANFNDSTSPVHLTKDIDVTNITGLSKLTFTSDSTLNFGNYGVLKFYIKLKGAFASGSNMFQLSWYNDNTPISFPLVISVGSYGMTNNVNGVYIAISIPISDWQFVTMVGNRLVFSFQKTNATGIYLDWIQLQTGAVSSATFVKSITMNDLDSLLIPTITNPNSNPLITFAKYTVPPNVVLINNSTSPGQYSWGKIDLSSNLFINTFPTTSITPGPNGTYLGTEGGIVQWLPKVVDTTITHNGVYREVNGVNSTDSLSYGYWKRDSAALVYDNTYLGMNGKTFSYQQGATDFWKIASNGSNAFVTQSGSRFEWTTGINVTAANNLTLGNDGNVFTVTGNTQINALTTANWQSGSQVVLIFSGTPTVKNNTAGGAGTARILLAGSTDFTAAANDALTLVYDGFNWHETARKVSGGSGLGQRFGIEDNLGIQDRYVNFQAYWGMTLDSMGFFNFKTYDTSSNNTSVNTYQDGGQFLVQAINNSTGNQASIRATSSPGAVGASLFASDATKGPYLLVSPDEVAIAETAGSINSYPAIFHLIFNNTGTRFVPRFIIDSISEHQVSSPTSIAVWDADTLKSASIATVFAANRQTLQQTFDTEVGGSVIAKLDTVLSGAFTVKFITSTGGNYPLYGQATTGYGFYGHATSNGLGVFGLADGNGGAGVQGESDGAASVGVWGISASGQAVLGVAVGGIGGVFRVGPSSTNTVVTIAELDRFSTGTPAANMGGSLDYKLLTSNGSTSAISNQIISKWTTPTTGAATSQLSITGANSSVTNTLLTMEGTGRSTFLSQDASYTLKSSTSTNIAIAAASLGTGQGVNSTSLEGIPIVSINDPVTANAISTNLWLQKQTQGTSSSGIGEKILFTIQNGSGGSVSANEIISQLTTVTAGSETSKFIITGINSGAVGNRLVINGDGTMQFPAYGAGTATFDASGNITSVSDVRLKDIQGYYNGGLNELMNVNPIIYKWNEKSGMEMQHNYIGFSAQNIRSSLGMDAIGINQQGYLSIQDRAILATLLNGEKDLYRLILKQQIEIDYLKSKLK